MISAEDSPLQPQAIGEFAEATAGQGAVALQN